MTTSINKNKRKPTVKFWTKMKRWIKNSFIFIMESVFLWSEREAKSLFETIFEPTTTTTTTADDNVKEKANTYVTNKNYSFVKRTYEDLFRKKMKGKEGKLVKLIKSKPWSEYSNLVTEANSWIFDSDNNSFPLVSFKDGSDKIIGFANADINIIKPGTILLYLGLTKIAGANTNTDLVVPHWLFGEKKLYGWIFVEHFIVLDSQQ